MLSQTSPNLLTFKINVCTNLSGLPNLPAYPPIYMYLDYILLYPVYEPTYLGYLGNWPAYQPSFLYFVCLTHQYTYLPTYLPGAMVTKPTGISSDPCDLLYLTVYYLPIWVTYLAHGYMYVKSAKLMVRYRYIGNSFFSL